MSKPSQVILDGIVSVMQYLSLLTETLIYTALVGGGGWLVILGWDLIREGEPFLGLFGMSPVLVVCWVGARERNGIRW